MTSWCCHVCLSRKRISSAWSRTLKINSRSSSMLCRSSCRRLRTTKTPHRTVRGVEVSLVLVALKEQVVRRTQQTLGVTRTLIMARSVALEALAALGTRVSRILPGTPVALETQEITAALVTKVPTMTHGVVANFTTWRGQRYATQRYATQRYATHRIILTTGNGLARIK